MTIVIMLFILLVAVILLPSQVLAQKNKLQEVEQSLSIRLHQLKQEFQFRTRELARRLKSADLAQEEWQALSTELQLDTTAAIESTQIASSSHHSGVSFLTGGLMLGFTLIVAVSMYQYSDDHQLALQHMNMIERLTNDPEAIADIALRAETIKNNQDTPGQNVSSQQILEQLFLAMRVKIDLNPADVDALRSFAMFSARVARTNQAITALNKAIKLEPDNIEIQVELAQMYASSKDSNEKMKANRILSGIIQQYPAHEGARLLLGFNSFSLGFYDVAIKSWKSILSNREPGTSSSKMLEASIEAAQKKLDERLSGQLAKYQPGSQSESKNLNHSGASIAVKVTISDEIKAKLSGNETLFVFAKAVDGPKFPVAVVKLQLKDLAGEVVLSDMNAMQAQFSLSKFSKVTISARISLSGYAIGQVGDINSQKVIIEAPFTHSKVEIEFISIE